MCKLSIYGFIHKNLDIFNDCANGVFTSDSRYVIKQNILAYGSYGNVQTTDDNNRNVQTVITDRMHSGPVANFSGAAVTEIGFMDFDSEIGTYFINNIGNAFSGNSRSGQRSLALTSANYFSKSIIKTSLRKHYIFSIWANSTAAGTITISLSSPSSTTYSQSLPISNSGGIWKYYQIKIPVSSMSNTFTAAFQSNSSMLIDDFIFYPADAIVNSAGYDQKSWQKTVETDNNGQTQYFEYDKVGRLIHVRDQDKNIVVKKSYISSLDQSNFNSSIISFSPNPVIKNQVAYFNDDKLPGNSSDIVTYSWNFGDG
ncbi:MAG: hypothetical protein EOP48_16660, partial [Sphingobacteriales bacterium]